METFICSVSTGNSRLHNYLIDSQRTANALIPFFHANFLSFWLLSSLSLFSLFFSSFHSPLCIFIVTRPICLSLPSSPLSLPPLTFSLFPCHSLLPPFLSSGLPYAATCRSVFLPFHFFINSSLHKCLY